SYERRSGATRGLADRDGSLWPNTARSSRQVCTTANSRQIPGTPFNRCSPRSSNPMPDPATRSVTVLDTTTSAASAMSATRHPTNAVAEQFNLAGVQPGPHCDAESSGLVADGAGAADGSGWPVEGGQEAVAHGLDLAAPKASEVATHHGVVLVETMTPGPVPH